MKIVLLFPIIEVIVKNIQKLKTQKKKITPNSIDKNISLQIFYNLIFIKLEYYKCFL